MGKRTKAGTGAGEMRIEYVALDEVRRWPRNPKGHALEALDASFARFGFVKPLMVDEGTGKLVAGHGRLEALERRRAEGKPPPERVQVRVDGMWLVPVQRGVRFTSEAEARAYLLADNRTQELGGWVEEDLADILAEVGESGFEGTGYTGEDLEGLLATLAQGAEGAGEGAEKVSVAGYERAKSAGEVPREPPAEVWVKRGDVLVLGRHRVLVGDSRSPLDFAKLMAGRRAAVVVTSPPYATRRAYDEASGFRPVPPEEYVEWYREVAANLAQHLAADGSYFLNIRAHSEDGQRSLYVHDLVLAHARQWGWRFVDDFVWRDTRNGVPGKWSNRFKDAWEPVFHFSLAKDIKFRPEAVSVESEGVFDYVPGRPDAGSGSGFIGSEKPSGYRAGLARPSNVIEAATETTQGQHTAPFPLALPRFFLKAFSDEGDAVLDPFGGSGTTLVAAEELGRDAYLMELSPRYAQGIVERWEAMTGEKVRTA